MIKNTMNLNYTAIDRQLDIWHLGIDPIRKGAKLLELSKKVKSDFKIAQDIDKYAERRQVVN